MTDRETSLSPPAEYAVPISSAPAPNYNQQQDPYGKQLYAQPQQPPPVYQQPAYAPPPQAYSTPPPQQPYMGQQQPSQPQMGQPPPATVSNSTSQTQNTTVVVNVNHGVNHCCHCLLCVFTGGLWAPCWIAACAGICCQRPCG